MPGHYTESRFVVEAADCDPFGLINYNRYLDWVNATKRKFFEHQRLPLDEMAAAGFNLVTVNLNLRCLAPCRQGDSVAVRAAAERLTPGSIYMAYTGRNAGSNETIFRIDTIMYPLDLRGRVTSFPPGLYQRLQPLISS